MDSKKKVVKKVKKVLHKQEISLGFSVDLSDEQIPQAKAKQSKKQQIVKSVFMPLSNLQAQEVANEIKAAVLTKETKMAKKDSQNEIGYYNQHVQQMTKQEISQQWIQRRQTIQLENLNKIEESDALESNIIDQKIQLKQQVRQKELTIIDEVIAQAEVVIKQEQKYNKQELNQEEINQSDVLDKFSFKIKSQVNKKIKKTKKTKQQNKIKSAQGPTFIIQTEEASKEVQSPVIIDKGVEAQISQNLINEQSLNIQPLQNKIEVEEQISTEQKKIQNLIQEENIQLETQVGQTKLIQHLQKVDDVNFEQQEKTYNQQSRNNKIQSLAVQQTNQIPQNIKNQQKDQFSVVSPKLKTEKLKGPTLVKKKKDQPKIRTKKTQVSTIEQFAIQTIQSEFTQQPHAGYTGLQKQQINKIPSEQLHKEASDQVEKNTIKEEKQIESILNQQIHQPQQVSIQPEIITKKQQQEQIKSSPASEIISSVENNEFKQFQQPQINKKLKKDEPKNLTKKSTKKGAKTKQQLSKKKNIISFGALEQVIDQNYKIILPQNNPPLQSIQPSFEENKLEVNEFKEKQEQKIGIQQKQMIKDTQIDAGVISEPVEEQNLINKDWISQTLQKQQSKILSEKHISVPNQSSILQNQLVETIPIKIASSIDKVDKDNDVQEFVLADQQIGLNPNIKKKTSKKTSKSKATNKAKARSEIQSVGINLMVQEQPSQLQIPKQAPIQEIPYPQQGQVSKQIGINEPLVDHIPMSENFQVIKDVHPQKDEQEIKQEEKKEQSQFQQLVVLNPSLDPIQQIQQIQEEVLNFNFQKKQIKKSNKSVKSVVKNKQKVPALVMNTQIKLEESQIGEEKIQFSEDKQVQQIEESTLIGVADYQIKSKQIELQNQVEVQSQLKDRELVLLEQPSNREQAKDIDIKDIPNPAQNIECDISQPNELQKQKQIEQFQQISFNIQPDFVQPVINVKKGSKPQIKGGVKTKNKASNIKSSIQANAFYDSSPKKKEKVVQSLIEEITDSIQQVKIQPTLVPSLQNSQIQNVQDKQNVLDLSKPLIHEYTLELAKLNLKQQSLLADIQIAKLPEISPQILQQEVKQLQFNNVKIQASVKVKKNVKKEGKKKVKKQPSTIPTLLNIGLIQQEGSFKQISLHNRQQISLPKINEQQDYMTEVKSFQPPPGNNSESLSLIKQNIGLDSEKKSGGKSSKILKQLIDMIRFHNDEEIRIMRERMRMLQEDVRSRLMRTRRLQQGSWVESGSQGVRDYDSIIDENIALKEELKLRNVDLE